jgi:hypothetical protein
LHELAQLRVRARWRIERFDKPVVGCPVDPEQRLIEQGFLGRPARRVQHKIGPAFALHGRRLIDQGALGRLDPDIAF